MGSVLALIRNFWLGVWLGLELNIIAFIPLFTLDKHTNSQAGVKYFLIQSASSFLLLFRGLYLTYFYEFWASVIIIALATKMGAAPIFLWLPLISEMIRIKINVILITVQKLVPLILIFYITQIIPNKKLFIFILILRALIGAVGGLNEITLRKLIRYSSINHIGWMIFGIIIRFRVWFYYYLVYCVLIVIFFYSADKIQRYEINLISIESHLEWKPLFSLCLLSLGGLPPLLGFGPKWVIINEGASQFIRIVLIVLLIRSAVTLFFYIRVRLNLLLRETAVPILANFTNKTQYLTTFLAVNILSLPLILLVIWSLGICNNA